MTKEFLNKMDSNNFEMNGNEIIPRNSIKKTSNQESYYEFKNNLDADKNPDKGIYQIPKINNEYIRNEANHQTVQSPKNNISSLPHSNLNLGLGTNLIYFIICLNLLRFCYFD
jgi:hypothetical protein